MGRQITGRSVSVQQLHAAVTAQATGSLRPDKGSTSCRFVNLEAIRARNTDAHPRAGPNTHVRLDGSRWALAGLAAGGPARRRVRRVVVCPDRAAPQPPIP